MKKNVDYAIESETAYGLQPRFHGTNRSKKSGQEGKTPEAVKVTQRGTPLIVVRGASKTREGVSSLPKGEGKGAVFHVPAIPF